MNELRKAAEMALEALDYEAREEPESIWIAEREALRQALDDKPPVKSYCGGKPNYCTPLQSDRIRIDPVTGDVGIGTVDETAKRKSLAELLDSTPVDETVKGGHEYVIDCPRCGHCCQQREWVGLTDDEIKEIIGPWGETPIKGYTRKLFDQIEAKLKEKNHG